MSLARFGSGLFSFSVLLVALCAPALASAHEVYVLSAPDIVRAMAGPPMPIMSVIAANLQQFIFWAFLCFVVVTTIFFMSISRFAERLLMPFFHRVKQYASLFVRMSIGASLLASAYHQALFGPELTFSNIFGAFAPFATAAIVLAGFFVLFGLATRFSMFIIIAAYVWGVFVTGLYMLTYAEYLDAVALFFILERPSKNTSSGMHPYMNAIGARLKPYRFAILRVLFGVALVFASVYAKLLHPTLTLMVVDEYNLTSYWLFRPFEPHFLVLGAALIELLCGAFFIIGFEVRHTSLFLFFWLTLSLFFFGESIWPHIIIFGMTSAFFLYGYDRYSLEGRYFKKRNREPVL